MNIAAKLAELRRRLRECDDFQESMGWFFDNLGSHPEFLAASRPIDDHVLFLGALDKIAEKVMGRPAPKPDLAVLHRIPAERFVHGFVMVAGHPASAILFEADGLGMYTMLHGGLSHYGRMMTLPLTGSAPNVLNN